MDLDRLSQAGCIDKKTSWIKRIKRHSKMERKRETDGFTLIEYGHHKEHELLKPRGRMDRHGDTDGFRQIEHGHHLEHQCLKPRGRLERHGDIDGFRRIQ